MKDAKPTLKAAQRAFCHECMGYYQDGERDCQNTRCQFYSFNKYAKMEPDLSWTTVNPSRVGRVLFADCESRPVSKNSIDALKRHRGEDAKNEG